ncbi:MAG: GspH/FimT family pseudopilin [Burkholderiales bacterium]|nr:GspH/FimT family pseudopilin [Burkholderiales bacterium]
MLMIGKLPRNKVAGFTIIELAIAMAVFGFLILAAAPSLQDWFKNTRIRGAAESLQNGILTARVEAIRRNRPITFWLLSNDDPDQFLASCSLSESGTAWMVSVDSPAGNCDDAPSLTTTPMIVTGRTTGDSGKHVAISATQSDGTTAATSITFNSFGSVVKTPGPPDRDPIGQIDITNDVDSSSSRSLRIVITANGKITLGNRP